MKKLVLIMLIFTMLVTLSACFAQPKSSGILNKEGIAPYNLSESEKYILQSFDMQDTSQIISFNAPKGAIALNVNVYSLQDGKNWVSLGGGGISLGEDGKPTDQLSGAFTMQLKENYAIDFVINANGGKASYKTDEIMPKNEIMASTKGFLQEFQEITVNAEIPVALMVYDDNTRMESWSLQDFFEPSKFADMEIVQVVTLEFSDK